MRLTTSLAPGSNLQEDLYEMVRAKGTKNSTQPAAKPTVISRAEPKEIRSLAPDLQEKVRARAYELWEQHGRRHGSAENDWLQAEKEILGDKAARKLA